MAVLMALLGLFDIVSLIAELQIMMIRKSKQYYRSMAIPRLAKEEEGILAISLP
jgi:hypothetical protein